MTDASFRRRYWKQLTVSWKSWNIQAFTSSFRKKHRSSFCVTGAKRREKFSATAMCWLFPVCSTAMFLLRFSLRAVLVMTQERYTIRRIAHRHIIILAFIIGCVIFGVRMPWFTWERTVIWSGCRERAMLWAMPAIRISVQVIFLTSIPIGLPVPAKAFRPSVVVLPAW